MAKRRVSPIGFLACRLALVASAASYGQSTSDEHAGRHGGAGAVSA